MYQIVRVAALTAVDDKGRVVKDDRRNLVLDSRDKRIAAYRQRWYLSDGGREIPRNAQFPIGQRDEADSLRVQLMSWHKAGTQVDHSGRHAIDPDPTSVGDDSSAPSTRKPVKTIEDGVKRYLDKHKHGSKSRGMYDTNLNLLVECLREQPDGEVRYDPVGGKCGARSLRWDEINTEICEDLVLVRRFLNINEHKTFWRDFDRHLRWLEFESRPQSEKRRGQAPHFVPCPSLPEPRECGPGTEAKFSIVANKFFAWAKVHGYLDRNPWTAAKDASRKPEHSVINRSMVPDIDEMFAMADHMAAQPGGADHATMLRLWAVSGYRPEEWWALQAGDFGEDADGPHIMVRRAEVVVSGKFNVTGKGSSIETKELKSRRKGEERRVPIPIASVAAEVKALVARQPTPSSYLSPSAGLGQTARRHWVEQWYNPARNAVLENELSDITPRFMRHAAITWWLESGIPVDQVAQRAGNSALTILLHYASATKKQTRESDDLLRANAPRPRLRAVGDDS